MFNFITNEKNRFENKYFCFYLILQLIILLQLNLSMNVILRIVKLNACLTIYDRHLNIEEHTKSLMNFNKLIKMLVIIVFK